MIKCAKIKSGVVECDSTPQQQMGHMTRTALIFGMSDAAETAAFGCTDPRKDASPADARAILCHFWVPALAGHVGHAGHAGWLAKCGIAWACHPSLVVASQPSQALGHPRSWARNAVARLVA